MPLQIVLSSSVSELQLKKLLVKMLMLKDTGHRKKLLVIKLIAISLNYLSFEFILFGIILILYTSTPRYTRNICQKFMSVNRTSNFENMVVQAQTYWSMTRWPAYCSNTALSSGVSYTVTSNPWLSLVFQCILTIIYII